MRWTSNDPERRLGVYLDDHRAGAAGGAALARRMLEANRGNYLTATMIELTDEINGDLRVLEDLIQRLGHTPNRLKIVLADVSEKVGRLKANGHLRRYSPLSRLEEFEMLSAGIMVKASLWRSCELALTHRPEVADLDFGALRKRAESQRDRLEAHRGRIVEDAFAPADVASAIQGVPLP